MTNDIDTRDGKVVLSRVLDRALVVKLDAVATEIEKLQAEVERLKAQLSQRYTQVEVAQWLAAYHGKYRKKTLVEYVAEARANASTCAHWPEGGAPNGDEIEGLRAEVEWLKVELERQRILHNECAQCGAALHDCTEPPHCDGCVVDEDKFAEWEVATATSPERLKAHTWQQERAAVVAWLRLEPSYQNRPWAVIMADIERGGHWPEGGTPNGGP